MKDSEIYDSIITGLKTNPNLAGRYAKKKCSQCTGKGWFERDLGMRTSIIVDICPCIEKKLRKEIEAL